MKNKVFDFRTSVGKSNHPKKRNLHPKTVAIKKRSKSSSSKNSSLESSSFATDDSLFSVKTKMSIGRFFYESGLDFEDVNLPTFRKMISHFSKQTDHQILIPTSQELQGWIFEDALKEMREHVDRIKKSWAETGCTILLDGWTNEKGQDLVNILVESPKGTVYLRSSDISDCLGDIESMILFFDRVIKEVGINNIIQIVTYSTSPFMKEVGKQLMEKYRSLFWTVSASCSVDLMLEKMKGIDVIKGTLHKTKVITRFIEGHPIALKLLRDQTGGGDSVEQFLNLENIVLQKENLTKIFLSSDMISKKDGRKVAEIISDRSFWTGASTTLQAAIPLVRAIEWMYKTKKEQIGYIYETIDQVKETIKEGFGSRKQQYMQFWKVIDEVWTDVLYSPLHSAGYFFNPNLFYSSDVYIDPEVATGVLCCIVRAAEDLDVQNRITVQMEKYRTAAGGFGLGCIGDPSFDVSPVEWWSKYGTECPELQRLAIRILGQTCDGASKFGLKRSSAETLLAKGMNRAEQKNLADMVFVRYNMHLKNFASGKVDDVMDDGWIVGKAKRSVYENGDIARMELDGGSTTDQVMTSCVRPKVEEGVIGLVGPKVEPKEEPV